MLRRGAGNERFSVWRLPITLSCSLLALALSVTASAATTVAVGAERPALRVDRHGNAEVSWSAGSVRRYLLVPPEGRVYPGRRLSANDVSRSSTAVAIPFRRVLRRTPDGRFWALQAWRVRPDGPVELRFSRWRGGLPRVTLQAEPRFDGEVLSGRATFAGRAIPLFSPTPEGKRIRSYAYLERLVGQTWRRFGASATDANGAFRRFVRAGELASRYRAVVTGPNVRATLAPDAASAVVLSSRRG